MDPNQTPEYSEKEQALQETGLKARDGDQLVQSHLEVHDRKNQKAEQSQQQQQKRKNRLAQIDQEIKDIEKRLQEIRIEQLKQSDPYSEAYLNLEHQKTELKKRLVDLSYHAQVEQAENVRESRRKDAERQQKWRQEREKRKQQIEEKLASDRKERQKMRQNSQNKQQGAAQEEKIAKQQRQLRIAQIESELAESRLRRSRMASLNAELDYLRATYDAPYWRWRDYFRLYSYPYLPSPYLSPYSSPYLYPYSFSSYLPPYSSYLPPYSPYLYPYSYLFSYRYRYWI